MRLKYKINIIFLGTLVVVALALTLAGVLTIDTLTRDLNHRLMESELAHAMARVAEAADVLEQSGVANVASYVKAAQDELLQYFREYRLGETGRLYIISPPNTVVLHPDPDTEFPVATPEISYMAANVRGLLQASGREQHYVLQYDTFPQWNWVVVLSMTTGEMYAQRDKFLHNVVIILLLGLLCGSLLFLWFSHSLSYPVRQLAHAAKGLARGQWDRDLPPRGGADEINELTDSFQEMSRRLSSAYLHLETQAAELQTANEHLESEIRERGKAEQELAALNRHLEQLVEVRTHDLAEQAEKLEAANRELRVLDQMKSSFLSSVSHELRTPLTSVLGFAKLILRDFTSHFHPLAREHSGLAQRAERITQNLAIIQKEGERLTRMVNDFLDLTKIESGRLQWNDQDIQPNDVLKRAVGAVRGVFSEKPQVALFVDLPPELPTLHADPDRLLQVFINLLNNAAKFTPKGEVRLSAQAFNNTIRFIVTDTGIGIRPEDHQKIFDKFHQVTHGDTLDDKTRGTGLGLAICRQIISHYHGSISVESELDQGSTFIVDIPRTPPTVENGYLAPLDQGETL